MKFGRLLIMVSLLLSGAALAKPWWMRGTASNDTDFLPPGVALPGGVLKTDPYLGTNEIFTQQVEATVPYRRLDYGAHPLQIKVTYQGCAEAGLCYPLITKVLFPTTLSGAGAEAPSGYRWEAIAIVGGML